MEILKAIDRVDDVIHEAPPVPLTDSVRLDPAVLRAALGRLRYEADTLFEPPRFQAASVVFDALDRLDELVAAAKPVPLTDQVRLNQEQVYEQLDGLRQLVPLAIKESRGSDAGLSPPAWAAVLEEVDALEGRLHELERPLIPWLKVDADVLRDGLARVRVSAVQNLGPPSGHGGPVAEIYAALDELGALVGDAAPAARVRVRRLRLFVMLERARTAVVTAGLALDAGQT